MNYKLIKENGIIIPENYPDVIVRLLQKYGVKETLEDMVAKIERDEVPMGEIISQEVLRMYKEESSIASTISVLHQKLGLEEGAAEKMANDLKNEILPLLAKSTYSKQIESDSKKGETQPISKLVTETIIRRVADSDKTSKKSGEKDTYREPIE